MGKVEILCHIFYGVRCFLCVQSIDLVYKAEFSVQKNIILVPKTILVYRANCKCTEQTISIQSKLLVYTADC